MKKYIFLLFCLLCIGINAQINKNQQGPGDPPGKKKSNTYNPNNIISAKTTTSDIEDFEKNFKPGIIKAQRDFQVKQNLLNKERPKQIVSKLLKQYNLNSAEEASYNHYAIKGYINTLFELNEYISKNPDKAEELRANKRLANASGVWGNITASIDYAKQWIDEGVNQWTWFGVKGDVKGTGISQEKYDDLVLKISQIEHVSPKNISIYEKNEKLGANRFAFLIPFVLILAILYFLKLHATVIKKQLLRLGRSIVNWLTVITDVKLQQRETYVISVVFGAIFCLASGYFFGEVYFYDDGGDRVYYETESTVYKFNYIVGIISFIVFSGVVYLFLNRKFNTHREKI